MTTMTDKEALASLVLAREGQDAYHANKQKRHAVKVCASDYICASDLEALGVPEDCYLYLSRVSPPSLETAFAQIEHLPLRACPCCGGGANIIGLHMTNEFSAICRKCGLETAHKFTPEDAAIDWNRRSELDRLPEIPHWSIGAVDSALEMLEQRGITHTDLYAVRDWLKENA